MKALNRAIGRTVSQLARYGGDEFHPLMKHALVQHLSMLLAMERKQLEVAGISCAHADWNKTENFGSYPGARLTGDGTGEALPAININSSGCTGQADAKAVAAHLMRGLKRSMVSGGIIASSTPQENGRTAWERYLDSGVVSDDLIKGLGLKREDGPDFAVPNERDGRAAEHPVPVEQGLHIDEGDVLTRLSNGQPGVWTFGADYTVMAVAADGDVTVRDDSGYPRVMSAEAVRRHFSVAKKQTEPKVLDAMAAPAPDAAPAPAYQVGDMLEYAGESGEYFTRGNLYPVSAVSTSRQYPVYVIDDEGDEHGLRKCLPEFINRGQPAPRPAPDAIDMTDPANWQEGDIVLRTGPSWTALHKGCEYRVAKVKAAKQEVYITRSDGLWTGYTFDLLRDDKVFKWLRHGESEAAA